MRHNSDGEEGGSRGPRGTCGGYEDYAEIIDDEGDYSTPASKFFIM